MTRVEYVLPLGENVRKRHVHETDRGMVVAFVVQLEAFIDATWRPIVRYDSAHGFCHIDVYRRSGESRKEELVMSFADALTLADEDILARWEEYRYRFLEGEWP